MEKKKAVLVTGAFAGIGLGIAEKFLKEGCTVFITSDDLNLAEKKAAELKEKFGVECIGIKYNPLHAKVECNNMFTAIAEMGYLIDKLVCAHDALGTGQDTLQVAVEDWENVVLANVMGSYIPARVMTKELVAAGCTGGDVVFIGSSVDTSAVPGRSAYVASKGAISSMTRALALDFAKHHIKVNCVVAGPVKTERWDLLSEEKAKSIETLIPLGKVVSTEQVANAVWFFASSGSSGVTGASLVVDGGLDCVIPGAF